MKRVRRSVRIFGQQKNCRIARWLFHIRLVDTRVGEYKPEFMGNYDDARFVTDDFVTLRQHQFHKPRILFGGFAEFDGVVGRHHT